MSWQAYADDHLLASGKVSAGAILELSGEVRAASPGLTIADREQTQIVAAFEDFREAANSRLVIAGREYNVLHADSEEIDCKCREAPGDGGVLIKTEMSIIVALFSSPLQLSGARKAAQSLADHLTSYNY